MEKPRTNPFFRRVLGILLAIAVFVWFSALVRWAEIPERWSDLRGLSRTGFVTRVSIDEDGSKNRHTVFVPHSRPKGEKLPVILYLNGGGENGDDGFRMLCNNMGSPVWEMKGRFPFLLVASQCRSRGSWSARSEDTQRALRALNKAISDYNGDPDRVILTGPSAGGAGTYAVATGYPGLFAGIVPVSAADPGIPVEDVTKALADVNLACWAFHNERDASPGLVAFNTNVREQFVRAGLHVDVTSVDRDGHNCWMHYQNPAMFDWMQRQSRIQNRSSNKFRLLADDSLSELVPNGFGVWMISEPGIVQFVPSGEESSVQNSSKPNCLNWDAKANCFDFHFDYQSEVETPLIIRINKSLANGSKDDVEVGFEIFVTTSSKGSSGILSSSGEWLTSANSISEHAFQPKRWAHCTLRRENSRFSLRVNEWEIISFESSDFSEVNCLVGLVGTDGSQRWREIRGRKSPNDVTSIEPLTSNRGL